MKEFNINVKTENLDIFLNEVNSKLKVSRDDLVDFVTPYGNYKDEKSGFIFKAYLVNANEYKKLKDIEKKFNLMTKLFKDIDNGK